MPNRLALVLMLLAAQGAAAATFTVDSLADSGPGTLRQAVGNANASAGPDEVVFLPGLAGTITLTSGQIAIQDHLVIHGPGAGVITVTANQQSRIFLVQGVGAISVTLSGLTASRGNRVAVGGGIHAVGANLTILDSVLSGSLAGIVTGQFPIGCGGNVAFHGSPAETLRIVNSTVTFGNSTGEFGVGYGGNLCVSGGRLVLERSTVSNGRSGLLGGGIYAAVADVTIDSSTISGNTVAFGTTLTGFGGGIHSQGSQVRTLNATISGNSAGRGGGISVTTSTVPSVSSLLLRLTTVSDNRASVEGGSIVVSSPSSTVQLDHSIVANGAPEDVAGQGDAAATITADYSLIESPGDTIVLGAYNLLGSDPLLGPLANNGGPTLTHLPLTGSPVIDAGSPAIPAPPATDQRGHPRIAGPAVDLGSVEVQPALLITEVPTLSQWAMLVFSGLLFAAGVRRLRQDTQTP